MIELEINLGEIEVLVMGKYLPLRYQSYEENISVANVLIDILAERLTRKYDGDFSFEIISIDRGCIKIKLKIIWKKVCKNTERAIIITAALATIAASAKTLFSDEQTDPIKFKAHGIECEARYSDSKFIIGCSVVVSSGDTLSQIVDQVNFSPFSKNQVLSATFLRNRNCFIDDNMNLLRLNPMFTTLKK